jgi:hypothetical protein
MHNTYNTIDTASDFGSDIFVDTGKFRVERFSCQLNGSWQRDMSVSSGKTEVYFNDGVTKIDMIIAFEESNENSR